jgi:hypothetical protein
LRRSQTNIALSTSVEGDNGALLAQPCWLPFPEQGAVEIWWAGCNESDPFALLRFELALTMEDGELLLGLRLALPEIWSS